MKFLYNLFINRNLNRVGYWILALLLVIFVALTSGYIFLVHFWGGDCGIFSNCTIQQKNEIYQSAFQIIIPTLIFFITVFLYMTIRRLNDIGHSFIEKSLILGSLVLVGLLSFYIVPIYVGSMFDASSTFAGIVAVCFIVYCGFTKGKEVQNV